MHREVTQNVLALSKRTSIREASGRSGCRQRGLGMEEVFKHVAELATLLTQVNNRTYKCFDPFYPYLRNYLQIHFRVHCVKLHRPLTSQITTKDVGLDYSTTLFPDKFPNSGIPDITELTSEEESSSGDICKDKFQVCNCYL